MSSRLIHHGSVAPTRALLSPFGIGISRHVTFAQSNSRSTSNNSREEVALITTRSIAAGAPLLILADSVMLTSQAALDADVDSLVPPPAEMLGLLKGDAVRLDEAYLAYYLALRYFTKPKDWYAMQIDLCGSDPSPSSATDKAATALWQRASRDYVSPPLPLFLAATRYVRTSAFYKPGVASTAATVAETVEAAAAPPPPSALAVAPVLDVLARTRSASQGSLTACTAKEVTEKYLTKDLRGVRQALVSKDAACLYWALLAHDYIPAGGEISLSSQSR